MSFNVIGTAWKLGALFALLSSLSCEAERVELGRNATPADETLNVRTSALLAGGRQRPEPVQNPHEGNSHALQEGKRLYAWFNCAGCHGAIGGGAIGPPLRDASWIYGSEPQNIYRSIVEGRPQGMPAYGNAIPDDALWKLVGFVTSLGDEPPEQGADSAAKEPDETSTEQPREDRHAPQ